MMNGKPLVEYSDVSSEALSGPEAGEIQSDDSTSVRRRQLSDGELSPEVPRRPRRRGHRRRAPPLPPPPPPVILPPPLSPPPLLVSPSPPPPPPPVPLMEQGRLMPESPDVNDRAYRARDKKKKKRREKDKERGGGRKKRKRHRYTEVDERLPSASPISSPDDSVASAALFRAGKEAKVSRRRTAQVRASPGASLSDGVAGSPNGDRAHGRRRDMRDSPLARGLRDHRDLRELRDSPPPALSRGARTPPSPDGRWSGRGRPHTPPPPPPPPQPMASTEKRRKSRSRSRERERRRRHSPRSRSRSHSRSPR